MPSEVHTLNDAILAAARATDEGGGTGRRRIVYVISDGKEYGSTAKAKDVIKYLQHEQDCGVWRRWWATPRFRDWASSTGSICR